MIKAIIFDLDGTLIDSRKANVMRYNAMAKSLGFPLATSKAMKDLVNSVSTVQIIHRYSPSIKLTKEAIEKWEGKLPRYSDHISLKPDVKKVLFRLAKRYRLGLVTNRGSSTKPLLANFGLLGYFEVIITAQDVVHPKPHKEPLLKAMKLLGVKKEETIYVGDLHVDHLAAVHANIRSVLLNTTCIAQYHCKTLKRIPVIVEGIDHENIH